MRRWKRLIYYLLINVLVSACTVVGVLALWERLRPSGAAQQLAMQSELTPELTQLSFTTPGLEGAGAQAISPAQGQPTETPEPTAEEVERVSEYTVQSGDTLGSIASRFGLTIEDLVLANELDNPDRLEVGQVLNIPGGESQEVPTEALPTEPEQPGDTPPLPSPTQPAEVGEARVSIDSVVGAGDLETERVLLRRTGPGELSLAGWRLVEAGGEEFVFPQLTLFEGGAVNVYTKAGQPTVVDLFWGLSGPVWEPGETVTLLDSQNREHATFQIP